MNITHNGTTIRTGAGVIEVINETISKQFDAFDRVLNTSVAETKASSNGWMIRGKASSAHAHVEQNMAPLLIAQADVLKQVQAHADRLKDAAKFLMGDKDELTAGLDFERSLVAVKVSGSTLQKKLLAQSLTKTAEALELDAQYNTKRLEKSVSAARVIHARASLVVAEAGYKQFARLKQADIEAEKQILRDRLADVIAHQEMSVENAPSATKSVREKELNQFHLRTLPDLQRELSQKEMDIELVGYAEVEKYWRETVEPLQSKYDKTLSDHARHQNKRGTKQ